ncbi:hypothetical protein CPC08DRAFT_733902 [Agrocybe pediades]|nr:hypothetical protein CPC08DRAFT_733902 [Agrocybe pediades]
MSKTSKSKPSLFSVPSAEELQACWELCRLQNGMGSFSIAMAYQAEEKISAVRALLCALKYVALCTGVKSLVNIDCLVERTKNRALSRGSISLERAWAFFCFQVIVGVVLAFASLSPKSLCISALVCPLFVIYPTCKRWTNFAPVPLAIVNVGMFMGWADLSAQTGRDIPWNILVPMYIGTCFWTITYEKHQNKVDDVKIGIHSLALFLGKQTKPVCMVSAACFFILMAYGGMMNGNGVCFFGGILLAGTRLFSLLSRTDVDKPRDCLKFFLDTVNVGKILLVGNTVNGYGFRRRHAS